LSTTILQASTAWGILKDCSSCLLVSEHDACSRSHSVHEQSAAQWAR
jgi:hypothetical protein